MGLSVVEEKILEALDMVHLRVMITALSWHYDDVARMTGLEIAGLKEPFLGMEREVYMERVTESIQKLLLMCEDLQEPEKGL